MTKNSQEKITIDHDANEVSCDGGGGALGHPVVWYSFDSSAAVTCGYCGRLFVKMPENAKSRG